MSKKIILVTGGTGLVGKALQEVTQSETSDEQKNEEWIFIGSKDGDLTNLEETKKIFQKFQPTHVVHLAAKVGGLFHNMDNNLEFLRENMQINDNVLLTSHEFNCQKVVSCLSTCVFPSEITYPIDESMVHNGPPHFSNFGYSYAKRYIDVLNQAYSEKYGHKFTSIIPCNIFGPHDNFKPKESHVIPGMIHRLYQTMYEDEPNKPQEDKEFVVYGSGSPMRQFIYSKDLAKLMIWAVRNYESVEPIIFCGDVTNDMSILQVAEAVKRAFRFLGNITFDKTKADGILKKTASNAKLRSFLPDFQFTDFDVAMQETVQWYIDNHKTARK